MCTREPRATIGFGFTSDWLKKWRENFEPINEWSNHKPKQFAHYFRYSVENRSMNATLAVKKGKPEKNSGFNGIQTHGRCDTSVLLYQLSYQATGRWSFLFSLFCEYVTEPIDMTWWRNNVLKTYGTLELREWNKTFITVRISKLDLLHSRSSNVCL